MSAAIRFIAPVFAALLLSHCASTKEDDEPLGQPELDHLEHAQLDPAPETADGKLLDNGKPMDEAPATGLAPVSGKDGRFVIRDAQGAMRVDGTLKQGRMDGLWKYFDPSGRRLAEVGYRADQRQGPVTLYYVSTDGKAAGRKRMTGTYGDGSLDGMTRSWYPSGGKELERDFDHGILQGARGWQEDGKEMTDGAAQTAALQISKSEDALLSELEAFVQLKIRQHAPEKTGPPTGKP